MFNDIYSHLQYFAILNKIARNVFVYTSLNICVYTSGIFSGPKDMQQKGLETYFFSYLTINVLDSFKNRFLSEKKKRIILKRRQITFPWRKTHRSKISEAQMANYSQKFFSLQDQTSESHLQPELNKG